MTPSAQLLSVLIPFLTLVIIQTTPLKEFHVPILGLTTFIYLLFSFIKKSETETKPTNTIFTSLLITFLVLSVIQLTGGTYSLFFFLLYFLAFLLAFTMLPESVFAYAALAVLFYLFTEGRTSDTFSLSLRLISLTLLSPLAYFFGKEYQEREEDKLIMAEHAVETEAAAEQISKDIHEVIEENKASLSPESIEKLNDVLEETQEIKKTNDV